MSIEIMPLGDSITDGYNVLGGYRTVLWESLLSRGIDVNFVGSQSDGPDHLGDKDHEGHPGATIGDIAASVEGWLIASQPDLVLLMLGTNNLRFVSDGPEMAEELDALIDQIYETLPNTYVLVASIAPNADPKAEDYSNQIPGLVEQRSGQGDQVGFVDVHSALTLDDLEDGVHPNAAGYNKIASTWYDAIVDVAISPVNITATDSIATEVGNDVGVFTVSRSGLLTEALTVHYSVSGSATSGTDYEALTGTAVIPAGQTSVDIIIQPLQDTDAETPEEVTLTLLTDPDYQLNQDNVASISVLEDAPPNITSQIADFVVGGNNNTDYTFQITYSDNLSVDVSSISNTNIKVIGPNSFEQFATPLNIVTNTDNSVVTVTYVVDSPVDGWTEQNDGEYTVVLQPSEIGDINGNFAVSQSLGTFSLKTVINGLKAEYFDGVNFDTLLLTRTDATINFDWGADSPDAAIPDNGFSVRWSGQVEPQYSETYTFYVSTDDGVRLWVNGQLLIDEFFGVVTDSATITLVAGQRYDIQMEYYEWAGGARAQLEWSSASQPKQVIPQSRLFSQPSTPPAPTPGTVAFAASAYTLNEDGTTTQAITIVRTDGSDGELTLAVDLTDITTTASDYSSATIPVTFADGQLEQVITLPLIDDADVEASETLELSLNVLSGGATLGAQTTTTVTLLDNDVDTALPGDLSFSTTDYTINEDGTTTQSITVNRSGGSSGSLEATVELTDGSATTGADYEGTSITVSFADGDTAAKTITIPIIDDSDIEGDETVNLTLKDATGNTLSTATLTIEDNDVDNPGPTSGNGLKAEYFDGVNFDTLLLTRTDATINFDWGADSPDAAIPDNGFSVRWSGQVEPQYSETYTFYVSTDDGVRLWVNGQLLIDEFFGVVTDSATITLVAGQRYDIQMEYYEWAGGARAQLEWSSASQPKQVIPQSRLFSQPSTPPAPTPGTVAFAAPAYTLNEDGTTTQAITIVRTDGSDGELSLAVDLTDITTTASDYSSATIPVTFADGQLEQVITLPLIDDADVEASETLELSLNVLSGGATLGAQTTTTVTLLDNDVDTALPGDLSFSTTDYTINEDGTTTQSITVNRSGGSSGSLDATVELTDGSATTGVDYEGTSITVSFADGDTTAKTITIPIIDDSDIEGNETVNLTLKDATGNTLSTATLTIEDNDVDNLGPTSGNGLKAEYFDGVNFDTLLLTRTDATIDFDWGADSPDAAIPDNGFSVRWSGQVEPQYSETYTFYVSTDDGVRLWVNGQLLIDEFFGVVTDSATITLVAGQRYDIQMEYYEWAGGARAQLEWSSASQPKQVIPQSRLFSQPSTPPAPTPGTVAFAASAYTLNEDGTTTQAITIVRTDGSDGELTLAVDLTDITTTASDYSSATIPVTFADGQLEQVITLPLIDDVSFEGNEELNLSLSILSENANLGNQGTAIVTILDNDPDSTSRLVIDSVSVNEGNDGVKDAVFTVTLLNPNESPVIVDYSTANATATSGKDFLAQSGTLTFSPGETEKTVNIQIFGDTDSEDYEAFYLNLGNASNATISTQTGVATIQDDDYVSPSSVRVQFPESTFENPEVANVKDYGAKGDGITDDTEAILQAMAASKFVYFPNGTYLVRNTLNWNNRPQPTGQVIQGESQEKTIIKLADNAEGFDDPQNRKPLITYHEGGATGNAFFNGAYDITVDVGVGNPGAAGIRFLNNNQGGIRDVTIRSSDPTYSGSVGLLMDKAWPGPSLIKGVTVDGFDTGIEVGYQEYGNIFEDVTLKNQQTAGLRNFGNIVTIRNLDSDNSVPAIINLGDFRAVTSVIDSTFAGGDSSTSAIDVQTGTLYVRNLDTSGYQSAISNGGTIVEGNTVSEYVYDNSYSLFPSAEKTLQFPIEDTPVILYDPVNDWANIEDFGAVANDDIDDTAAFQQALSSGKSTVYLPNGNFLISDSLQIGENVRMITGTQALLTVQDDLATRNKPVFKLSSSNHDVVVLERFFGEPSVAVTDSNFYWIENDFAGDLVIRNMGFGGAPYRNTSNAGRLFIEDVVGDGWIFDQQQVWARQMNPEGNLGPKIVNNGGDFWLLGIKTEGAGTVLETNSGGRTELIGGLIYPSGGADLIPADQPAFITTDSQFSIAAVGESRYIDGTYTILVEETQGGETRQLLNSEVNTRRGSGFNIPLYASSRVLGDELVGDAGTNVLISRSGSDRITGGGGADIFVYNSLTEGMDTITDFGDDDLLAVSASGFGGGLVEGSALSIQVSQTGILVASSAPTPIGTSANFLHDTDTGILRFDKDGIGPGVAMPIAELANLATLGINQIQVIA